MSYTTVQLESGHNVEVRPRTYAEWEEGERARIDFLDKLVGMDDMQAKEVELHNQYVAHRTQRLSCCIKNFEDLKKHISIKDVAELEHALTQLEKWEIPLGNSAAGGAGQATPDV